jgi:hypothetical protein
VATQASPGSRLISLVENFDRDTAAIGKQIRELLAADPQPFQDATIRLLKSSYCSSGILYVVSLLVATDSFLTFLCDPALTSDEAVALARTALEFDSMLDVNLAKKLVKNRAGHISPSAAERVMDVLDEISNGNRLMPSLMRLSRQSDPHIRLKAVIMIGRARRSVKWVQSRFDKADPRARANAVEALWGIDTVEARDALRSAARDSSNRVAGNALFALYRMGDGWMIAESLKMAASDAPLFRASAAWVMGQTCDPVFSEALGRMMGDASALVRKRAFSALGKLKSVTAKLPE